MKDEPNRGGCVRRREPRATQLPAEVLMLLESGQRGSRSGPRSVASHSVAPKDDESFPALVQIKAVPTSGATPGRPVSSGARG